MPMQSAELSADVVGEVMGNRRARLKCESDQYCLEETSSDMRGAMRRDACAIAEAAPFDRLQSENEGGRGKFVAAGIVTSSLFFAEFFGISGPLPPVRSVLEGIVLVTGRSLVRWSEKFWPDPGKRPQ
jgi:hypothetical protein